MFLPAKEQKIFDIGNVKVGGRPGELPTVLCGSIFYHKHKIVEDPVRGIFDKREAERLINQQDEWSDRTGNPCMVDVVGETHQALIRYLDFVSGVTDAPMLLNGPTPEVRMRAAEFVVEVGLLERVVYTSINYTVRPEELEFIKEKGIRAVIIQTFNPRNPMPSGSLSILREGKLLELALKHGVMKPLLLPPVLDVPSIGLASETIRLLKDELGLPVGVAPCGVIGQWAKGRGKTLRDICTAGVLGLVQSAGADFIIYGAIRKAPSVFPVCAVMDAIITYTSRMHGVKPLVKDHPLYKYLSRH